MVPSFRLSFWMHAGVAPRSLPFEAANLETAYVSGARLLAEALGRPSDFASLDRVAGRFIVGAGVWSRSGFYRLAADGEETAPVDEGACLGVRR